MLQLNSSPTTMDLTTMPLHHLTTANDEDEDNDISASTDGDRTNKGDRKRCVNRTLLTGLVVASGLIPSAFTWT
jgi:hypothetical protein